jgi:agmatine/peptidylarginine deiminase
MQSKSVVFPAEWYPQSGVMLTWPHGGTDWAEMLDEVEACFIEIGRKILKREKLLVVTPEADRVRALFSENEKERLTVVQLPTNDSWARDHGAITVIREGKPVLLDFKFNGWGLKFASHYDNLITSRLVQHGAFNPEVVCENHLSFALEGGSLESDGKGTLLTTAECLLSPNRNGSHTKEDIEMYLKNCLGASRVLWLHHGFLEGDDTDSHVDTLARFCSEEVIAYVQCEDRSDIHFEDLKKMEEELKAFRTAEGNPYTLIPLPMADETVFDGCRLPATYANFLIINGAVLVPVYNSSKDAVALSQLKKAFPNHDVVTIDCSSLIKQHGSLHCVTMQFPEGIL